MPPPPPPPSPPPPPPSRAQLEYLTLLDNIRPGPHRALHTHTRSLSVFLLLLAEAAVEFAAYLCCACPGVWRASPGAGMDARVGTAHGIQYVSRFVLPLLFLLYFVAMLTTGVRHAGRRPRCCTCDQPPSAAATATAVPSPAPVQLAPIHEVSV